MNCFSYCHSVLLTFFVKFFRTKNTEELASIDAKIEDAAKNAGDTEVIEGLFSKARYYTKIGSWSEAAAAYDDILSRPKTVTGKKIDANMEKARIYLFTLDQSKLKTTIDEAKRLNDVGGDWDRRNRLKIYEAHACLAAHDLKAAAKLLLDCVATFTCTEVCTYKEFVFYTVITNIIALDRNDLRKKIINDPHVLTEIRDLPNAKSLSNSIYQCDYKGFFESIIKILPEISSNRFLKPLTNYIVREYRVLAYSQFLEAYKR
jgi:26S proteasome regulatory subunit N7